MNELFCATECNKFETFLRTAFYADTAAYALVIVYCRVVVLDCDGLRRTSLDALHTTDTTDCALLTGQITLVLVHAEVESFLLIERNKVNDALRAGLDADLAGFAGKRIYNSDAVNKVEGSVRAGLDAVAETETTVVASFGSAEELSRSLTAHVSAIVH